MSGLDAVFHDGRVSADSVLAPPLGFQQGVSLSEASFSVALRTFTSLAHSIVPCDSVSDLDRFISCRDSLPEHLRGFVVPYGREEYLSRDARLFLTFDRRGGVAVIDGELSSLFSLSGAGYGDMLVRFAIEQGAHRLSCYDTCGKLPTLYRRHGFQETARAPWNDEYAPKMWNYAVWGRPDYVEMVR